MRLAVLRPDPETARSWVEQELSRPQYHRTLLERVGSWVQDLFDGLRTAASGAPTASTAVVVVLVALLAAAVLLLATRLRLDPAAARSGDPALGAGHEPPEVHRRRAEQALAADRPDEAVVEAFRAIAGRATERGVLEERPGRTAHELAVELSPAHPDHADALARGSLLFDGVFYGGRAAGVDDARAVLTLDDDLRDSRPVAAAGRVPAPWAAPR